MRVRTATRKTLALWVFVSAAVRVHSRREPSELLAFWAICYALRDRLAALILQVPHTRARAWPVARFR